MPDEMLTRPPVKTTSGVLALSLPGVDGDCHSLASLAGEKGTAVVFIANGCPTVRAYEERLKAFHDAWRPQGIQVVAINANNPHLSPPDTFGEMEKRARDRQFNFPYLKDAEGTVAKEFGARTTPHAFLLDGTLRVIYQGRIDDSRIGDRISSRDLENAIADVLAGRSVAVASTEPFGCSIVW
jgi:thiol-disulfide isomerase/thioredoxin